MNYKIYKKKRFSFARCNLAKLVKVVQKEAKKL